MDENETTSPAEPTSSPAAPAAPEPTSTALPSEAVRNSPEYRALQEQLRSEARRRGNAEAEAAKARRAAEQVRLEAETRQQDAMQQQVSDLLGEDGLATWQEFADLSATDPVAAARKWAELTGKLQRAQVVAASGQEAPNVTEQQAPQVPPQPRTLDAGLPLTSVAAPDPDAQRIADLEQNYGNVLERNRTAPNRVTESERATAMMGYLEVAIRKGRRALGIG